MVHDTINNTPVIMYTTKQGTIPFCAFSVHTLSLFFITLVYNIISLHTLAFF